MIEQLKPPTPEQLADAIRGAVEGIKYQADQILKHIGTSLPDKPDLARYIQGEVSFMNYKLSGLRDDVKKSFPLPPKPPIKKPKELEW